MNKQDFYNMLMVRVDYWNITPEENRKAETKRILNDALGKLVRTYILLFSELPDLQIMQKLLEQHGLQGALNILRKSKTNKNLGAVFNG